MLKRLCLYTALLLLAASLLEGCAVHSALGSLTYEISPPHPWGTGCLSYITGVDLCAALRRHKLLAAGFFAGALGLLSGVFIAERRNA